MGKALVVKGLKVNNPIGLVSFKGIAPAALAAYYARNTSITEAQAESLNTLVKTLISEGLWNKLHYFYPFLGSTIEDMTLECTDTENEDLFALSGTSGLTVDGNFLSIDNTRRTIVYPTSATLISPSNVSFIIATGNFNVQSPIFMDANNGNKRVELATNHGGGTPMRMSCGLIEGETGTSKIIGERLGTEYLERVVCGTINNGNGVIWNEKTKYAEGTGNTNFTIGRVGNVFSSPSSSATGKFAFFAMAQYMTEAEWGKFYDALLIFLKATGKHS